MACNSIVALPKACGSLSLVAGVEKLYMIAYKDLVAATAAVAGETYTKSVGGLIDDIGLAVGKVFVEIGTLKSAVGITNGLTKNVQNGTSFYKPTLTLALADLTIENETFVKSVTHQPVAILVKGRNGKWYFAGGNGQFELSAMEGGLGIAEGDDIGYKLTFEGIENEPLSLVDTTIVASLYTP